MTKFYYIKKRVHPQQGTYYIPLGDKLHKSDRQKTVYGRVEILRFDSEEKYKEELKKLNITE